MQAKVFIATSLDGYIADSSGKVDFLNLFPDPVDEDMGFDSFISGVDCILMGRKTFDTVLGFGVEWPYRIPVFVRSSNHRSLSTTLESKIIWVGGDVSQVLDQIRMEGFSTIYVDGAKTIQSFLRENLIREMIITTIPVLLGTGLPLFGDLRYRLLFKCVGTKTFSNGLSQAHFIRQD